MKIVAAMEKVFQVCGIKNGISINKKLFPNFWSCSEKFGKDLFHLDVYFIYVAWWWEKYLSKRSPIKCICSWRDKSLYYENWADKRKHFL